MSKESIGVVNTATAIHEGDYSSLYGKSFLHPVCTTIKQTVNHRKSFVAFLAPFHPQRFFL